MKPIVFAALAAVPLVFGPTLPRAQDYDRPPAGFGDDGSGAAGGGGAVDVPDPGSLAIRLSRMEGRIRDMTGQIEELQNANRKLVEQLQKFQSDVDSRFASGGGRQRRSEADLPRDPGDDGAAQGDATRARKPRRDDSFNPDAADAGAPGRPKPLGSAGAATADNGGGGGGGGPMDLSGGRYSRDAADADSIAPTLRLPSATPRGGADGTSTPHGTAMASAEPGAVPNTPRGEFEAALGLYRDKQYEEAEKGFTAFIQKNPKSKLAADATYYLGETYAQRGRSREAAEQYLKISTDYANSTRAPDAMLHLGMSLKALGAKEQACATFSEVPRKYPNAPAYVRNGAEREAKRDQC